MCTVLMQDTINKLHPNTHIHINLLHMCNLHCENKGMNILIIVAHAKNHPRVALKLHELSLHVNDLPPTNALWHCKIRSIYHPYNKTLFNKPFSITTT